jgi:hypothetical protein
MMNSGPMQMIFVEKMYAVLYDETPRERYAEEGQP